MDWRVALGIGGGILQIVSVIPYIRDMIKGTTRPNVVTYVIYFILALISLFAQWSAGASWSIFILLAVSINTFIVIILCFNGFGYKKYGLLDWACLLLGVVAIVVWRITNNPMAALFTALLANILGDIPTIIKTYKEPHTELALSWFIAACAAVLGIISTRLDLANLLFPVYYFVESMLISGLAFSRKPRIPSNNLA